MSNEWEEYEILFRNISCGFKLDIYNDDNKDRSDDETFYDEREPDYRPCEICNYGGLDMYYCHCQDFYRINIIRGDTLLHAACQHNRIEIVKRLIDLGADINAENMNGTTPLELSVLYPEIVKLLLEKGAINYSEKVYSPLNIACFLGCLESVKILLRDYDIENTKNKDENYNCLDFALYGFCGFDLERNNYDNFEQTEISKKVKVHNYLEYQSNKSCSEVIDYLISKGAILENCKDNLLNKYKYEIKQKYDPLFHIKSVEEYEFYNNFPEIKDNHCYDKSEIHLNHVLAKIDY